MLCDKALKKFGDNTRRKANIFLLTFAIHAPKKIFRSFSCIDYKIQDRKKKIFLPFSSEKQF
jgi:hypothetical protein